MTDRLQRVQELFEAALALEAHARDAFLEAQTRDDESLRREVLALMRAHAQSDSFLEDPAARIDYVPEQDADIGRRIGAYRLVERLGAGGMGTVFLAERADAEYEKQVAIKLIKRGMDTDDILRRFRTERQVLATLDHPNIARLLDGGATDDGRPFLVMELVRGAPLGEYCEQHALSVEDRIRLFGQVCEAVHYAHQNLVIHRDLKPSNTLVTADGTVKLLDFGIARVLSPSATPLVTTEAERAILTPRYASPEQVRAKHVTTATDVYSLGIMLYELLTGQPAYDMGTGSPQEIEQAVCDQQPVRPSTAVSRPESSSRIDTRGLARSLRGDLDTIILKAIRKEPERRYASVQALADDLGRNLDGLPVSARPDSLGYRTAKFVRRHAIGVGVASLVLVTLLTSSIVSFAMYVEASTQRRTAERVSGLVQEMFESIKPGSALGRDVSLIKQVMDRTSRLIDAELADEPRVAAELHLTTGVAYISIDEFDAAEHHLLEAMRLRDALYRPRHLQLAEAHFQLGRLRFHQSRYEEGEERFRTALAIYRHRRDRQGIAATLSELGLVLQMSGQYAEAESSYRQSLDVLDDLHEEATGDHADVLNSLGQLLMWRNRLDEAETPMRRALAIQQRVRGPDHPDVVVPHLNVARWCIRTDQQPEALEHLDTALAICDATMDPVDATRSQVLAELGDYHAARQEYDRAIVLYLEVLDIVRAIYPADHQEIGTTSNNLGGLLRRAGRPDEAEIHFRDALDVYRRVLGVDHFWCSIVCVNLAKLYLETDRCRLAEIELDEAIRIRRIYPDAGDWWICEAEVLRAACLTAAERYQDAEALLMPCIETLESSSGPTRNHLRRAVETVVSLYDAWDRPDDAARWRERLED